MNEYVTMIRNNVEINVESSKIEELKKEGFKVLNDEKVEKVEDNKPLKDMEVKELKALAKEKGIESYKDLTKVELLKALAE